MIVGCVVQARMGSTRLPGKSMMDICGKPVVERVLDRVSKIGVDKVILATTTLPQDDVLRDLAISKGITCFRGKNANDVLDRYMLAAASTNLDIIMRITADCPLIDWTVARGVLDTFLLGKWDYVSNVHPPTFPDGLDVEVMSKETLATAWFMAKEPYQREHVTPYIWQHPSPFRLQNVWADKDYSNLRWTLDTAEDLEWIRGVYAQLGEEFTWQDVLEKIPEQRTLPREIRL